MVGGNDNLRWGLRELSDALQAWKRCVLERRELSCPLAQRGLDAGHGAKRLVDDDEIEELITSACRLTALAKTILKSGSGYTHTECAECDFRARKRHTLHCAAVRAGAAEFTPQHRRARVTICEDLTGSLEESDSW